MTIIQSHEKGEPWGRAKRVLWLAIKLVAAVSAPGNITTGAAFSFVFGIYMVGERRQQGDMA